MIKYLLHATIYLFGYCSDIEGFNFGSDARVLNVTYTSLLYVASDFTGVVPRGGHVIYSPLGNCLITVPHHRLQCTLSAGGGQGLTWSPVVDGQVSVSPTTSYAAPVITSLALLPQGGDIVSASGMLVASCDGGDAVLLQGLNFGPPELIQRVRYGRSGVEYTSGGWIWLNDSALIVTLRPGIGKVRVVSMQSVASTLPIIVY